MGGAAGGFIGPDKLGVQLSFEHTREAGTTLGSGVVLVLDETVPLLPILRRWRSSSATSRAGSACPAGWAPCARRSCWRG